MRLLYTLLFYLLTPFIIVRLLWKGRKAPEYKKRWAERFAYYRKPPLENSIWIHAVSVGETIAAIPLIKKLQQLYPNLPLVITTMTPTGSERVQKAFGDSVNHVYVPYDYPHTIKKFLANFKPVLAIIMETELWPNLLHYAHAQNIPIILANARLSEHSFKRYRLVKHYISNLLNHITIIAAQSKLDTDRFTKLGATNVKTIGNIKFDIKIPDELFNKAKDLRKTWGTNRPIFIAASTHPGEEEQILESFSAMKTSLPDLLLVLVPRHPERFEPVTKMCQQQNFSVISYKKEQPCTTETDVVIGDTMGKLLLFYAASDVTFVGGSLTPIGGHNLLEPAAVNTPVITGPHLSNFIEISELLSKANGLIKINNSQELAENVIKLFNNKELQKQLATAANQVVAENRGTLNKLLSIINDKLS